MRAAVHPDDAVTFRGLRPNVNGYQMLGMGITFFPDSEVSYCAHLVGQNIGFTLMMAERQTRSVIRQRPQAACLVQGESTIVGQFGATAALERVFMQSRCPVSCDVDVECPGRLSCRGRRPLRIKDRAHQ